MPLVHSAGSGRENDISKENAILGGTIIDSHLGDEQAKGAMGEEIRELKTVAN